jgi:ABC-2 type transport system ATP-binding protein
MPDAITTSGLTKVYQTGRGKPGLRAVDHLDLIVPEGQVFGFLGPNGAGKTTTIRMLTGLTRPSSGSAQILGLDLFSDITRIKKRIGVVPEVSNLYDELSAFDNLMFAMRLYGVPRMERAARAEELLARFRLSDKRDTPFARLSRGMKRALTIAAALVHRPSLLFLDEPTTGLDVISARNLRAMIAGLGKEGITVFLTTHYLEEAERLCDQIAIVVNGRVVAQGTVAGLKASVQGEPVVEVTLAGADGDVEIKRVKAGADLAGAVRTALDEMSAQRVIALNTICPTLEDVFVKLTGLGVETMLADKDGKKQANAG